MPIVKVVAQNRRARYDYEILDTFEAGVMLTGPEAKSCRKGHINLAGSFVSFLGGKAVLKGAGISKYAYSSELLYDEHRDRQLLLKKTELAKLQRAAEEKGMTIVPLEVHAGKFIKIVVGLGRGKKKTDKRQAIKERETGRRLREGRDV
ncbi:MAG: SsrA-binding protein SmpB [Candidatus Peribacteraceae bacterium]|nr:SsrA-binding protein SmpB [Candidatus Peribacteraceae bacterium]